MEQNKTSPGNNYRIRVKETLGANTLDWINGLEIILDHAHGTVLAGWFPDQSALRGVMEYLWNLNLTILSVESQEDEEAINPDGLRRTT